MNRKVLSIETVDYQVGEHLIPIKFVTWIVVESETKTLYKSGQVGVSAYALGRKALYGQAVNWYGPLISFSKKDLSCKSKADLCTKSLKGIAARDAISSYFLTLKDLKGTVVGYSNER